MSAAAAVGWASLTASDQKIESTTHLHVHDIAGVKQRLVDVFIAYFPLYFYLACRPPHRHLRSVNVGPGTVHFAWHGVALCPSVLNEMLNREDKTRHDEQDRTRARMTRCNLDKEEGNSQDHPAAEKHTHPADAMQPHGGPSRPTFASPRSPHRRPGEEAMYFSQIVMDP
ncbi:hypothetical protein BD289DRAFT_436049 [Coniella lustricola]|uniref:Uncharacterized protein n=1 Tax=Coniella lustricola TaxID=2025994 RepID=A0A2T3A0W3_9PEZI|nr:hypothetical protein BD289DRAFT_440284 [Coniella lustricola]PSR83373.1 hypothetical protein BD289DRAFT_436049 [Coniella lustricola]